MKKTKTHEFDGWLQANAPEPDYKGKTGWRRILWRIVDRFDSWYGF